MRRDDVELCQMAIARGWISPGEVEIAMREQSQASDTTIGPRNVKPIGVVLVARGFLTDEQLKTLQELLSIKGVRPVLDRTLLGQILLNDKLVTRTDLDKALAMQVEKSAEGRRKRIGELLVELQAVPPATIVTALRKQRKEILECKGCNARFNVLEYKPAETYSCPKCASQLQAGTQLLDVDDTTVGIKPVDESELPSAVAAEPGPKVHFGKFIVMRELFRSPEGPVHLGWQKDRRRFVALLFVAREPAPGFAGKVFARLNQEARAHETALSGFIESGAYEGRHFVSWGLVPLSPD